MVTVALTQVGERRGVAAVTSPFPPSPSSPPSSPQPPNEWLSPQTQQEADFHGSFIVVTMAITIWCPADRKQCFFWTGRPSLISWQIHKSFMILRVWKIRDRKLFSLVIHLFPLPADGEKWRLLQWTTCWSGHTFKIKVSLWQAGLRSSRRSSRERVWTQKQLYWWNTAGEREPWLRETEDQISDFTWSLILWWWSFTFPPQSVWPEVLRGGFSTSSFTKVCFDCESSSSEPHFLLLRHFDVPSAAHIKENTNGP